MTTARRTARLLRGGGAWGAHLAAVVVGGDLGEGFEAAHQCPCGVWREGERDGRRPDVGSEKGACPKSRRGGGGGVGSPATRRVSSADPTADTPHLVYGSGFRVQGSGFRVQGSGFRVQSSGLSVPHPSKARTSCRRYPERLDKS